MKPENLFGRQLSRKDREVILRLRSPFDIQTFLDSLPYSEDGSYKCPLSVLRRREAHCFDGALFAAAALRRLGHRARIIYMLSVRDDDHLLAVYQRGKFWGAVAKSNFVGLRFREPVYRSIRELVMSYFEVFWNLDREKSLRAYTSPVNLARFDAYHWTIQDEALEIISDHLDYVRTFRVLTPAMIARLTPVDIRSFRAGSLGANLTAAWKNSPQRHKGHKGKNEDRG